MLRGRCLDETGRRDEALDAYRVYRARMEELGPGALMMADFSLDDALERPYHWDHESAPEGEGE